MKVRLGQIKSKLDWLQYLDISTDMKDVSPPSTGNEKDDPKNPTTEIEDDFKREMML